MVRDVYVADTDARARSLAIEGAMGRCWREFLLPLYVRLGLGPMLKLDPGMPDTAIDLAYLAEHLWLIGSPWAMAAKIARLQTGTGGFGRLLVTSYDALGEREDWELSLHLLVEEVLPICRATANERARAMA